MDKFLKRIVWLIVIIPAIYLAIVWNKLPEKVAMHFDLKGNVDRFGSKNELIIMQAEFYFEIHHYQSDDFLSLIFNQLFSQQEKEAAFSL